MKSRHWRDLGTEQRGYIVDQMMRLAGYWEHQGVDENWRTPLWRLAASALRGAARRRATGKGGRK